MKLNYKQAPLPFQGQKRMFIAQFATEISALPDSTIFVDLFGGSGLLSRTAKDIKPKCRVVYNDFDNFRARIKAIPTTNKILSQLRQVLKDIKDTSRISPNKQKKVLAIIEQYDKKTFVDYTTIGSSILFSGKYVNNLAELQKETFYNTLKQSDYLPAKDYLNGLEIRQCDYRELYKEFAGNKNAFFILDPPYLSTDTKSYSSSWKLSDYLDVLKCLRISKFAYFTSNKSSLVELVECLERNYKVPNPFARAKKITRNNAINYNAKYEDIMLIAV